MKLMYILWSGKHVFKGSNIKQILNANKQCEVTFPQRYWSKISENWKELVGKMLEKDQN